MARVCTLLVLFSALCALAAAQSGVSILFMGETLINGTSKICITNIGEAPPSASSDDREIGDALVCVTDNTTCCRGADGSPGGAGEWLINGKIVPGLTLMPNAIVHRNRGTGLVRLNVIAGNNATELGEYCCEIPDSDGVMQRLCVSGVLDDATCNPSTTPSMDTTSSTGNVITFTTPTVPSTTETTNTTASPPPPGAPTNIGAIVGAILGVLVAIVLIVIIIIVLLFVLSKRKKKTNFTEVEQLQTVVLETKISNAEGKYYNSSTKGQSTANTPLTQDADGAMYAEIDDTLKRKPDRSYSAGKDGKNGNHVKASNGRRLNYEQIDESKMDSQSPYTDVERPAGDTSHYEAVDDHGQVDLKDMYAIPQKKPSTGRKPSSRGSSAGPAEPVSQADLDGMYAVPDKAPSREYMNQPASRESSTGPLAGAVYAEISDPKPSVPKKSAQLEEYLETKPVGQFTHSNNEYASIDSELRPKSHTLQPLKKPLSSTAMSDNPLYDIAAAHRSNTISNPPRILSDNVYADPTLPAPSVAEGKKAESIYETIYSESLQPSSFRSPTASVAESPEDLFPYSSIYTLPTSPLPTEEKPLIVSPDNIEHVQNLGTGNFGNVILAKTVGLSLKQLKMSKIDDDTNVKVYVAVKMLKEKASSTMREAFEKEYKFMSRLNHPSVIRLLGIHMGEAPFIMMEYMEKGDLNQYLKNFDAIIAGVTHSRTCISTGTLVNITTQIASGMEYLAHQNFVHRDLATRNCLVGQNNAVKIADFGMSRNLYESHYYIIKGHAILPIRWMSTECFYGKFSAKSDVWAFGVTMWEIFTLGKVEPYTGMTDAQLVEDAVKGAGRTLLTRPEACPVDVFRVMEECWVHEPSERATFEDVFAHLSSMNFKYSSH